MLGGLRHLDGEDDLAVELEVVEVGDDQVVGVEDALSVESGAEKEEAACGREDPEVDHGDEESRGAYRIRIRVVAKLKL